MDSSNEPVDKDFTLDGKVVDTYGNILAKMARDAYTSRAKELDKLDHGDAEILKYSSFLSSYLYDVQSSLERVHCPCDERDWSFKARVDLFLDANLSHDIGQAIPPIEMHSFSADQFPGYKDENVAFLKLPHAMMQRWGPGEELSYLQAASLVQHYAVSINTGSRAPILDTTAYVKSYQGMAVWKHIEEMTFESESTLRHLLLPGKQLLNSSNTAHHIVQYLREHHVGLVSRFRVFPEFNDPHRFYYHGSVKKVLKAKLNEEAEEEGSLGNCRHSMCLVGYREVQRAGRPYYYFLLQNSWRHKQFVEVDQRYLSSVRAMVHFICSPQDAIRSDLPTINGDFAYIESSAGVDAPDGVAVSETCDCCGF